MSAAFPGPSDNLRTHDVLSDSLRLTWNAPASAVPVLGYQVSAQAGGTSGFSVVVVDTGSAATQAHVTGLHPGCWCASLRAHLHAPARAPQVPGAKLGHDASSKLHCHRGALPTNRYEFRVAARTEGGLGAMSAPSPPVQMARSAGAARSIPLSSPSAPAPVRPLMKGGTGVGAGVHGRVRAEARAPPSPSLPPPSHGAPTALAGGPSTSAAAAASSSAPAAEQELEYSEAKAAVLLWERTFESKSGRPPTERERAASPTYRDRLRRYKG